MKIHHFIGNFNIKIGNLKLSDKEFFNQFRNVLKLDIGERVILGDGNMNEGVAEIKSYGKDSVEVEVKEVMTNQNEPKKQVILYCAILKRENFELVVQKATEVGVKEIVPIITERTIKLGFRKDRLEKIIKEAAEQSGRGIVPILHVPIDFEKAVSGIDRNVPNLFFDHSGSALSSLLTIHDSLFTHCWVGPEGGWSPVEIELARKASFHIVSLGSTTLRAETAATVGTYLAIHNF